MKGSRKNAFWTFLFSFVPGCAEMYWGFMKMGVSLLIPFVGIIFLGVICNIDAIVCLDIIVYIYAFFHARNMAHMTDEEIKDCKDEPVFILENIKWDKIVSKSGAAKVGGILLVLAGLYSLAWVVLEFLPDGLGIGEEYIRVLNECPRVVTAVLIIALGIYLISGKKKAMFSDEGNAVDVLASMDTEKIKADTDTVIDTELVKKEIAEESKAETAEEAKEESNE